MTNAEKYLKDGVDIEEFIEELHFFWWANEYDVCEGIRKFLNAKAKKKKPSLTEDERVILRNLEPKMWNTILREEDGGIAFGYKLSKRYRSLGRCEFYNHLFQFIKNGEEYSIEELLKGE